MPIGGIISLICNARYLCVLSSIVPTVMHSEIVTTSQSENGVPLRARRRCLFPKTRRPSQTPSDFNAKAVSGLRLFFRMAGFPRPTAFCGIIGRCAISDPDIGLSDYYAYPPYSEKAPWLFPPHRYGSAHAVITIAILRLTIYILDNRFILGGLALEDCRAGKTIVGPPPH